MSDSTTLARQSVDPVARPIAIPMAAAIGVTLSLHSFFEVVSAASAPACARFQRHRASTKVHRLTPNQTPPAHSTLAFAHATLTDAVHATSWTTAIEFQPAFNTLTKGCG